MTVLDLDHSAIEYGFRIGSGFPSAPPEQPAFHRFDPTAVLLDPYARAIGGRDVWGQAPAWVAAPLVDGTPLLALSSGWQLA
jgi:isoamylase